MKEKKMYSFLAWSFIILGIVVSIFLLIRLKNDGWRFWDIDSINLEKSAQFGDYIGGFVGSLFSLAGFIFLFLTFKEQRDAFKKERFENHFFELIKLHKENINELSYSKYNIDSDSEDKSENRKVFRLIFEEFTECLLEVQKFLKSNNIDDYYTNKYKAKILDLFLINNKNVDLIQIASVDIAYNVVFFGVGTEGQMVLKRRFSKKYKPEFYLHLLHFLRLKPKREFKYEFEKWEDLKSLPYKQFKAVMLKLYFYNKPGHDVELSYEEEKVFGNLQYTKYYGGHQHRLGHYFRHLFQSYKFLDRQVGLENDEKYFYAKSLRAQLSTYEQALIFINSISSLGLRWEMNPEVDKGYSKGKLITTYNIIKNLPGNHIYKIYFKEYYPNVNYESDED